MNEKPALPFLNKKKQNFGVRCRRRSCTARAREQKFFGSFFQKRTAFLLIALSAAAPPDPAPQWFVPPPQAKSSVDTINHNDIHELEGQNDIVVHAQRRPIQRDPHAQETHDYQPAHSEAASPEPRLDAPSYCGSSYQTIGGQAATGADLMGSAGGHCD